MSTRAVSTHFPAWVISTTLSRTVIVPTRASVPAFDDTTNDTGLSPDRGMLLVIVIHGTSATADHTHRSCVAPPHSVGSLCWMTSNVPDPPAATKAIALLLTAYRQPACAMRTF